MFLYISLLVICASTFVDGMQGGKYSGIKAIPYQAQLYFEWDHGFVTFCGATIISKHWLVSAAHCIGRDGVILYQVRVGSSVTLDKGTLFNISQIIVHGDYTNVLPFDGDICLIKIEEPIEFNEYQQPIPISREVPNPGDIITVSGFGDFHYHASGSILRISHVPVIEDAECRKNYTITDTMFCSSTKVTDLCFGDSGSPAVFNGKLVGIVSQGCEYTAPNVFTKVSSYYDWILNHTGIHYD